MRIFFKLLLLALLALGAAPGIAQSRRPPVILAAASLQESLTAAARAWVARGHAAPLLSFAGSSALARQIDNGAPADLFISADEDWMNDVEDRGLLRHGTRARLLGNRLVLVAPAASRVRLSSARGFPLGRALGSGRLAMADPDAVPAGRYGKAALISLGVWPSVRSRIAAAENVRAALALVERDEAPFGIVYETDARASHAVRILGWFPASSYPPISYPIAVLTHSQSADAEPFRRFLLSAEAKAIFRRFGFITG